MEYRKPGRPKGQPRTGGRKKGTPNKATMAFKQTLESMNFNVAEQAVSLFLNITDAHLKTKLLEFIAQYSVSKPKETTELITSSQDQAEVDPSEATDLLKIVNGSKQ